MKNRKNMKIFVLYPNKKYLNVQRKFMTTVASDNVFNIALDGNFDECQKFVKRCLQIKSLAKFNKYVRCQFN